MYCIRQSRPFLYIKGLIRNWRECLIGSWHFIKLQCTEVPVKTVLLVEFNPFHGECLPGFAYYFKQLGYKVVLLSRYRSYTDSPFVRMPEKPRHFCLTLWGMRHFLRSPQAKQYDYIFYNSAHLFLDEYRYFGRVPEFIGGQFTEGKHGCGLIEHDFEAGVYRQYFHILPDEARPKQQLFQNTFMLTPLMFDGRTIPMLNPCYFGNIRQEHTVGENGRRIFLTIGNVSIKSRNFPALFKALKQLGERSDFEVWIIGKVMNPGLLEDVRNNVKVLGQLTFAEMYDRLEQADFFLPLLDPKTQPKYLDGCTSGSRQLILGFAIPPVIHTVFAKHFGLNEAGTIRYDSSSELADALKHALTLSETDYQLAKESLMKDAETVRQQSLENLAKRLPDVSGGTHL